MKIEDELLPLLLEVLTLRLQHSYNTDCCYYDDGGYTKETIASALNVFAGDVTVNVSKIIPLQVF
jgi:hypothetical protein